MNQHQFSLTMDLLSRLEPSKPDYSAFACLDCGVCTHTINEYYMLRNHIWRSIADDGMLCIGCAEKRLGRRLTGKDFIDAFINTVRLSDRLRERIES